MKISQLIEMLKTSAVFEFQHERLQRVPNNSTISAGPSVPGHMSDGSKYYLIIIPSVSVQPSETPNIEMVPRTRCLEQVKSPEHS
jgi:hypothetical protein